MPGHAKDRSPGVGIDRFDVFDLLTSLTDRSLIVAEEQGGVSRFSLLETVRQYARDLLMDAEESVLFRGRHLEAFLNLATEASAKLRGHEQMEWIAHLEGEHENLRAALEWSISTENILNGLKLCDALILFWSRQGHIIEGREWCRRALSSAAGSARTIERAKVLQGAGILAWIQGDYAAAQPLYQESYDILEEIGDRRFLSFSIGGLGLVAFGMDDYSKAKIFGEQAYSEALRVGDQWDIAWAGYFLGILLRIEGDVAGAFARYKEAIDIYRALGDRIGLSYPLYDMGLAAYYQGDFEAATPYLEESLTIRRETNDVWGDAESQYGLGLVAFAQQDYAKAKPYFDGSLALADQLGDQSRRASVLHWLGCIDLALGDVNAARARQKESLTIFHELGDRWGLSHPFAGFASLAASEGQFERAVQLWAVADTLRQAIGSPIPPIERARRDQELEAARQAIGGEDAFNTAWTKGCQLSIEEAVALSAGG